MPISKVGGVLFGPASVCWGGPCQQIRDAGEAAAVCLGGGNADWHQGWPECLCSDCSSRGSGQRWGWSSSRL